MAQLLLSHGTRVKINGSKNMNESAGVKRQSIKCQVIPYLMSVLCLLQRLLLGFMNPPEQSELC